MPVEAIASAAGTTTILAFIATKMIYLLDFAFNIALLRGQVELCEGRDSAFHQRSHGFSRIYSLSRKQN
jgi:hypothetical protein